MPGKEVAQGWKLADEDFGTSYLKCPRDILPDGMTKLFLL